MSPILQALEVLVEEIQRMGSLLGDEEVPRIPRSQTQTASFLTLHRFGSDRTDAQNGNQMKYSVWLSDLCRAWRSLQAEPVGPSNPFKSGSGCCILAGVRPIEAYWPIASHSLTRQVIGSAVWANAAERRRAKLSWCRKDRLGVEGLNAEYGCEECGVWM